MPCKPKSNTRRIMIGKQTPQNWNKLITSSYYSRKQTTKGVEIPSQTFAGSGHILLKRCYPTIIIWHAELALTRRNFCIQWSYDNSHAANRHQTYQSHNASGNQTRKLPLHTMICTPGRGSANLTSQYLTAITKLWQHPVHPKLQYDPNRQLTKWGALRESYQKIPQQVFPSQMDRMTEGMWIPTLSLMRIRVQSKLTLCLPPPAAQNTIYAITRSQIVMTTTDTDSVLQVSTERIRTLSVNARNLLCGKLTNSFKYLHGPPM